MKYVIHILECVNGEPTEFDGTYVKEYDPSYIHPGGYDGGILEVTTNPAESMHFDNMQDAIKKYRQSYGIRPWDGKPNRPLTAWSVSVEPFEPASEKPLDSPPPVV